MTCVYATRNDLYPPTSTSASLECDLVTVDARKPQPDALRLIMDENDSAPANTVVIGDSLFRDVAMAKACGAQDVYAKYGCDRQSDAYNLLREVSHWTQEDVEAEKRLRQEVILPSATAGSVDELSKILLPRD